MASGKLSPRQKMINMMYLVLTALLALNVSKEIINAFVSINESLTESNVNLSDRTSQTMADFELAMLNDKVKTEPFYLRAKATSVEAAAMITYIDSLKNELTRKVEALEPGEAVPAPRDIARKDDYDVPTEMLCGSEQDGKGHKASELKARLEEYKKKVLAGLTPEDQKFFTAKIEQMINTKDPEKPIDGKATWEMASFYHAPIVATLATLTKMQSDVKNVESSILDHLIKSIDKKNFKFDALQARVIAPSSYILLGQEYKADVFLAAYSSTSNPEIIVGEVDTAKRELRGQGRPIPVSGGLGNYTDRPGSEGIKKWGGVIKVKNPDNTYSNYPFVAEYVAARPAAVASADKMNVFYIGVDNPVSISVPGVPNEKVKPSITGGQLIPDAKSGAGKYIVKVTQQGEATININAELSGKLTPMGAFKFRVKRVPDPVAMVGGKKDGNFPKNQLLAQPAVSAIMENFDFELYFKVTKFKMSLYRKGKDPIELDSDNNLISASMKDAISGARAGDKVYFEYIYASGPDGTSRKLSSVNFVIQ